MLTLFPSRKRSKWEGMSPWSISGLREYPARLVESQREPGRSSAPSKVTVGISFSGAGHATLKELLQGQFMYLLSMLQMSLHGCVHELPMNGRSTEELH